jgi:nicotinamide-nucleotide amidase
MKATVLSIGTELTRGEIVNTNATWLCDRLTSLGAIVTQVRVVDDDPLHIREALTELSRASSVLVCTGGLGPTTDDLTAQTVAEFLGVELVVDEPSLERIRELLIRRGRELSASNAKQAALPQGCHVLTNDYGTAPGFKVQLTSTCEAYFLPGVPREMSGMFSDRVAADVSSKLQGVRSHQEQLRVFGLPESHVNDALRGVEETFGVTIGYRAHFPEVFVKALAFRDTEAEAHAASFAAAAEIERRLGDYVYARGDRTLVATVATLLADRKWTLGLAESCTGGLVAQLVTQEPASHYFRGGVVCYDNDVKRALLGVSPDTLANHGAVSRETVIAMANGIRHALNAEVGLSFSGIAGPTGGTDTKPVGLVHFAVSTPLGVEAREQVFPGERPAVQLRAAYAGLDLLRRILLAAAP